MNTILLVIVTIILPPLGVALQVGVTKHFWINLVLTLLGYIPGVVHGLWLTLDTSHSQPA